jgi:hypothetical protein
LNHDLTWLDTDLTGLASATAETERGFKHARHSDKQNAAHA